MKQHESGFSVAVIALGIRLDSQVLYNITSPLLYKVSLREKK